MKKPKENKELREGLQARIWHEASHWRSEANSDARIELQEAVDHFDGDNNRRQYQLNVLASTPAKYR